MGSRGASGRGIALRRRSLRGRGDLSHAAFEASFVDLIQGGCPRRRTGVFRPLVLWPSPNPGENRRRRLRVQRLVRVLRELLRKRGAERDAAVPLSSLLAPR